MACNDYQRELFPICPITEMTVTIDQDFKYVGSNYQCRIVHQLGEPVLKFEMNFEQISKEDRNILIEFFYRHKGKYQNFLLRSYTCDLKVRYKHPYNGGILDNGSSKIPVEFSNRIDLFFLSYFGIQPHNGSCFNELPAPSPYYGGSGGGGGGGPTTLTRPLYIYHRKSNTYYKIENIEIYNDGFNYELKYAIISIGGDDPQLTLCDIHDGDELELVYDVRFSSDSLTFKFYDIQHSSCSVSFESVRDCRPRSGGPYGS